MTEIQVPDQTLQASQPAVKRRETSSAVERSETSSVSGLRQHWRGRGPVAAGEVVNELLRGHSDYAYQAIGVLRGLNALGPVRTLDEHLVIAWSRWHPERAPVMSGRHAILGLALDRDLGQALLLRGVIGSMLSQWRPGLGTTDEPYRLVWDVLSDIGRELVETHPLLAAAFGAPAQGTVTLKAPVRAMAWAPDGERLAVLAGDRVYETWPQSGTVRPMGEFPEEVDSIGWGGRGVVGLAMDKGRARLVRIGDGSSLGEWPGTRGAVTAAVLSGDGSHAWLQTSGGVYRWTPPLTSPTSLTSPSYSEPAIPVAVDRIGFRGLLRLPKNSVLVVDQPPGSVPGPSVGRDAYWPSEAAPMIGWGPPRTSRCALVTVGGRTAVAYAESDGTGVWWLRAPAGVQPEGGDQPESLDLVCRIAAGPGETGALAVDPTGTVLAVAIGGVVGVWPLGETRASSDPVPAYDTDRPNATPDLLDADRDAQAIAALVSARDVRPPLSVGLFGAWGSGKSFILDQVTRLLKAGNRPEGYLRHIEVVEFNAWQYAEANLWASLVDRVLQVIAPVRPPAAPPEVSEADTRATDALTAVNAAAGKVDKAQTALDGAREKLATQRRHAAWLGAAVLVLAAAAVVATLFGAAGRLLTGLSAALALLGAAAGIVARAQKAGQEATDIADAGRSGIATVGRLLGRPQELAVQAKAAELRRLEDQLAEARADAKRLVAARDQVTRLATEQPLGALLHRLATISEYRDQLSLITRTREHFQAVDDAIRQSRRLAGTAAAGTDADGGSVGVASPDPAASTLERVVILIDDLDRCPPEKVVSVLEAVHLLFSFEMFVVLIAVDTRWLEQSLRIRYRQLLGRSATAAPTDYLEKIIQIPLHLLPLDDTMVRSMIAGLSGTSDEPPAAAPADPELGEPRHDQPDQAASPSGVDAWPRAATVPRVPLKPLPAAVIGITGAEAAAMSVVAPLVGTTPRAVKRFVNAYRLLKARSVDPLAFDRPAEGPAAALGDHEVVAFLLAVVTGLPVGAEPVLSAFIAAPPKVSAEQAVQDLPVGAEAVRAWFGVHRRYAEAPAERYAGWAREVARYSFAPPGCNERSESQSALTDVIGAGDRGGGSGAGMP
jgi:hypothetical protein